MAITHSSHIEYQSIVYEKNKQLFIRRTPFEIIKDSCLQNYTTYQGIKKAVIHHHGFIQKTPIPINRHQSIYTFPTHSPVNPECNWIIPQPLLHSNLPTSTDYHSDKSAVTFNNGRQLLINVSQFVLKKQIQRTMICMLEQ